MSDPKKVNDKKVKKPAGEDDFDFKKTTEVCCYSLSHNYRKKMLPKRKKKKNISSTLKDSWIVS